MRKRGEQCHLVMSDCYEILVPKNHFLRKLDKAIDFNFVEDLCKEKYHVVDGGPGRPAEPPVRMFKLLLLMFLYQVKFERAMERMTNDTISWRWYCGYAPDEPVASHKTMWLFRKRLGPDVFDSIFTEILNRCIDSGLVDNKRWHVDATKQDVAATIYNKCDVAAILTRAMIARIQESAGGSEVDNGAPPVEMDDDMKKLVTQAACEVSGLKVPNIDRMLAKAEEKEYIPECEKESECDQVEMEPDERLSGLKDMANEIYKDLSPCAGDKDARIGHTSVDSFCGYISTLVVDEKYGIALGYETYAGNVDQSKTFIDPYNDAMLIAGKPIELAADSGFDNLNIRKRLDADGVIGYISMMKPGSKTDALGSERFKVTKNDECYCVECPAKRLMQLRSSSKDGYLQYKGIGCSECSLRERCTKNKTGLRTFRFKPETRGYQERQWLVRKTPEYVSAMKARMATIEPIFGHAKTYHNLGKCIYRSKPMTKIQTAISLMVMNLEKYLKYGQLPQTT